MAGGKKYTTYVDGMQGTGTPVRQSGAVEAGKPMESSDAALGGAFSGMQVSEKVMLEISEGSAGDFFYFEEIKDQPGYYSMAPKLPEMGAAGPDQPVFKLRENYNRLVKGIAQKFLDPDGNVDLDKGMQFIAQMEMRMGMDSENVPAERNRLYTNGIDWLCAELHIPETERQGFADFCQAALNEETQILWQSNLIDLWKQWGSRSMVMGEDDTLSDAGYVQAMEELKTLAAIDPEKELRMIAPTDGIGSTRSNAAFVRMARQAEAIRTGEMPRVPEQEVFVANISLAEGRNIQGEALWEQHVAPVIGSFVHDGQEYFLTAETFAPGVVPVEHPGMTLGTSVGIYKDQADFEQYYVHEEFFIREDSLEIADIQRKDRVHVEADKKQKEYRDKLERVEHRRGENAQKREQAILQFVKQAGDIGVEVDLSRVDVQLEEERALFGTYGLDLTYMVTSDDNSTDRLRRRLHTRVDLVPPHLRDTYVQALEYYDRVTEEYSDIEKSKRKIYEIKEALDQAGTEEASDLLEAVSLMEEELELAGERIGQCRSMASKMFEVAWGNGVIEMLENEEERAALRSDMEEDGLDYQAFYDMVEPLMNSEKLPVSQVNMRVEESLDGLHQALMKTDAASLRPEMLTTAERGFAVENFDAAFEDVFSRQELQQLNREGKDIFDQIYIDGVSINKRYGKEFKDQFYYSAAEAMKCRVMAEVLSGKQVRVALQDADGLRTIPLVATTEIAGLKNRLGSVRPAMTLEETVTMISDSQDELRKRDTIKINQTAARMRQTVPLYPHLPRIEEEKTIQGTIKFPFGSESYKQEKKEQLFRLGAQAGAISDPQLVKAGSDLFADLLGKTLRQSDLAHPIYKDELQVINVTDMIYIDGVPAKEYLEKTGASVNRQEEIQAGIMAAFLSGQHHVDLARVGEDEYGRHTVNVSELRADLHFMDGMEKWHERTRAHKAEALARDTKGMERRQEAIRNGISEKMVARMSRQLLKRENPYAVESLRFINNGTDLAAAYFGEEQRKSIKAAIPGNPELDRGKGEFGGCVRIAQLYLMSQHPEIRYADLMDPNKYQEEKLEAGRVVAEAMEDYVKLKENPESAPRFEKLARVVAASMRAAGGIDVRRELLYAVGMPEDTPTEELRKFMESSKGNAKTNAFLGSVGDFAQSYYQALSRLSTDKKVTELYDIKENSFPVYRTLLEDQLVNDEDIAKYRAATLGMRRVYQYESRWSTGLAGVANAESTIDKMASYRVSMEMGRDFILRDGVASHMTPDFVLDVCNVGFKLPDSLDAALGGKPITKTEMYDMLYEGGRVPDRLRQAANQKILEERQINALEEAPVRTTSFQKLKQQVDTEKQPKSLDAEDGKRAQREKERQAQTRSPQTPASQPRNSQPRNSQPQNPQPQNSQPQNPQPRNPQSGGPRFSR